MCQHARAILGLDVIVGTLPNAKCQADSYDVALMFHVIEHVPDPSQTLSEPFRMLRSDGILVVETPRYDTVAFKLLGPRERNLLCEGRVYFFTTSTPERIAQKVGFSVLRHVYVGRSLILDRQSWNIGRISKIKVIQSQARGDLTIATPDRNQAENKHFTICSVFSIRSRSAPKAESEREPNIAVAQHSDAPALTRSWAMKDLLIL